MFNNSLFLSIIIFVMVSLFVVQIFLKTKKIKVFNIMIFTSLLSFWIPLQFFIDSGLNSFSKNKWIIIILPAIFQLTQAFVRVPFGILSARIGSRKIVIQGTFLPLLISIALMLGTKISTWSVIVCAIASGVYGSTLGMQSQYWLENWDKKKAFATVFIMLSIPMIAKTFSGSFGYMAKLNENSFKWIMIGVELFSFAFFIFYSLTKEKKETITLDKGFKSSMFQENKFSIKQTFMPSIIILFAAFIGPLSISFLNIFKEINTSLKAALPLLIIGFIAFAIYFLIPRFGIKMVKISSLVLIIHGSIILFIISITNYLNNQIISISIIMIVIGLAMFKASLFGIALHIDLKNPMLSLGIFLSFKSLSLGISTASANSILINVNQNTSLIIISSIILFFTLTTIAFTICFNKAMSTIENTIVKYEYN